MFKRMTKFQHAYTIANGWKDLVNDNSQKDVCTRVDIFNLKQKAKYLVIALKIALDKMPLITWSDSCKSHINHG